MAKRSNHYEAAFEAYLRARRVTYVAVDEAKRSLLADESLKSLDFLVSPSASLSLLVDVKGRRFPSGEQRRYWKNWTTADDLRSLAHWERLFGARFQSLLVFAFRVVGDRSPLPAGQMHEFRGQLYGFLGVRLQDYARHARQISPKWDTLALSNRLFRQLAEPFENFLTQPEPIMPCPAFVNQGRENCWEWTADYADERG